MTQWNVISKEKKKQEAIARRRQSIYQQGKEDTRWLNKTSAMQPNSVQVPAPDGTFYATTDLKDTFDAITKYWRNIWHRNVDTEEFNRLKQGQLTRPAGQPMDSDWRLQPIVKIQVLLVVMVGDVLKCAGGLRRPGVFCWNYGMIGARAMNFRTLGNIVVWLCFRRMVCNMDQSRSLQ